MTEKKNFTGAFITVTSLFFMWGFITVLVDGFIPRLKSVFELSYGQAGLVQVAWFLAYFIVSIPGGILISKMGYKKGIIFGLAIAGIGCMLFYPAASFREFGLFLLALFTLASGITILQVAANPYVAELGPEAGASRRLNLAQAFNSLGTTIAPIFAAIFLLSDSIKNSDEIELLNEAERSSYFLSEASAVQVPFLALGLTLAALGVLFVFMKLPKILSSTGAMSNYAKAIKRPKLLFGALCIFVYVGAEVAIGSYLVNYFDSLAMADIIKTKPGLSSIAEWIAQTFKGKSISEFDSKGVVGLFVTLYWGGAMLGRFIGSFLMKYLKPALLLGLFSIGAISLILITMNTTGLTAFWSALLIGLFNSIMFPTIFTLAIDGLGDLKPNGSAILCMAIVGGAFIPPIFGVTTDASGFKTAFIIPIVCYLIIGFFAYQVLNKVSWKTAENS